MTTDYDAPRQNDDDTADDSLDELRDRKSSATAPAADEAQDEVEADSYELPGADLSHEELNVRVLPRQDDEFTCGSCFLVKHRSQFDHTDGDLMICIDCAT